MNRLEKWVLQEMMEHLEDLEGQVVYGCDLAFTLFENENINGSYTCNAYASRQWIKRYWDELCGIIEDYEVDYGELPVNPFVNAEAFQVQIILHMASRLVGESDYIEEHWDNDIELTADVIKTIVSEWSECL